MSVSPKAESLKSISTHHHDDSKALLPEIDPVIERRALRKLDFFLLPLMTLFYLLSFLDRTNIGNAKVAGLQEDLKLSDTQYSTAVTVLYVPYILAELPSNLLMRRIGPNIMMPTLLTVWGMIVALQGTVKSYKGLVIIRAFLGLVEGPMFPGIVLYLSNFYTRKELALRISCFFAVSSLSGAFSGLLAAAIMNMDGMRGIAGWAWIFILEGTFTVVVGLVSFFLVPSTPKDMRFLNPAERALIEKRLFIDRVTATKKDVFSFRQVWASASSPHVILNFLGFFFNGAMLYGLALYLPTIVSQFGHSRTHTQLLSVPPFAVGFLYTMFNSYLSDRFKTRSVMTIVSSLIALAGFSLYLGSTTNAMKYGSLFLSVSGAYAIPPVQSAWMSNNSEPHYRRASSIALGFIAANAGGILSIWRFPKKEAPKYTNTTIMNIVFSAAIVVVSLLMALYLKWATIQKERKRDEILRPYATEKEPDGGDVAWQELGDQHPDFRYAL